MTPEQAVERDCRIENLSRIGMTYRAAATVVDAAMFGIGCIEGEVRARIEAEKVRPNGNHIESDSGPI
jgi:hypothetical protein